MRKIPIFFFLGLFCFQGIEYPAQLLAKRPATCCGRKICLCHHPKGASCDFRIKAKQAPPASSAAGHEECSLHKKNGPAAFVTPPKPIAASLAGNSDSRPFWQSAPCHSQPKARTAGFFKDFEKGRAPEFGLFSKPQPLFDFYHFQQDFLNPRAIDRPPRFFPSSKNFLF